MNKKHLILTIIVPLILAAILARLMTPTPEKAFIQKLSRFEKLDNVYWRLEVGPEKYEQYKINGEYYARRNGSNEALKINTSGEELRFGTNDVIVYSKIEDSKASNSVFWLDKLSVKDIKKGSIVKDRQSGEDIYDAQLNDGTEIRVTFYKGLVSKIEYLDIPVNEKLFDLENKAFGLDTVLVEIKFLQQNAHKLEGAKLNPDARMLTLEEFSSYLDTSDEMLTDDILDLKYAYKGIPRPESNDYEDADDDEYEYEEDEFDADSKRGHVEFDINDLEF